LSIVWQTTVILGWHVPIACRICRVCAVPFLRIGTACVWRLPDWLPEIIQPEKFIPEVKALGAHVMNVHYEACPHLHRVVQQIREAGMQPAVTINPATPVSLLKDIINDVYMVLIMSVNPGFGGQKFIEHSLDKVRELRELITVTGSQALIEVDGGVNLETGSRLVEAGADVLVAGNAVFSAPDPKEAIRALRNL
jgi:ribulose-phosphate 3-epimerase